MAELSIERVSHNDGVAERARKGTNAAHYLLSAPNMIGSFTVETLCGKSLGSSRDAEINMGIGVPGTLCKRCEKIYAGMLDAQDARENSAPKSAQAVAVAAYYAAGNPVPAEVASLPDPTVKGSAWSGHKGASEESAPFCGFKGEPVDGSDADGITGKCPECRGIIDLSDKGEIGKHRRYGVKVASRTGLKSKSIPAVEHGSVPGDTAGADKRRAKEIGKGKGNQAGTARFKGGADAGKGAREHGSVNGSANTGRVNLPPVQPKAGWLAVAGTGALSMTVRPGVDSGVSGKVCPVCRERVDIAHAGKSRGWRRAHSKRVAAWHTEQNAAREAKRAREIREGTRLPAGARKAARKAASVGSFSEGTNGSTGTVVHGGKRPAVAPKVKPRGKTRSAE